MVAPISPGVAGNSKVIVLTGWMEDSAMNARKRLSAFFFTILFAFVF